MERTISVNYPVLRQNKRVLLNTFTLRVLSIYLISSLNHIHICIVYNTCSSCLGCTCVYVCQYVLHFLTHMYKCMPAGGSIFITYIVIVLLLLTQNLMKENLYYFICAYVCLLYFLHIVSS